ncbi:MAG: hypothetical protein ACRDPJ_12940 [Nocardioidaceae bacterium]
MNATGIVDLGNEPNAVFMLEDELVGQTVMLSMDGTPTEDAPSRSRQRLGSRGRSRSRV